MQAEKGARLLAEDILKEAEEKAALIIQDANQQAAAIINSAKINAEEEEKQKLREAETKGKQIYAEILARAKVEARKELLREKEIIIENVFKEAEEKLRKHALSPDYKEDLVRITIDACRKLGSNDIIIRANRRDLEMLKSLKNTIVRELKSDNKEVNISLGEPIEATGGVKVVAADGKIEIDETFEGTIRRLTDVLRVKVAKLLFEGSR
ncbi:MAG: V-type ATP synthase subunit E family protein [Anaerolineales bacterium]|uniref:V-type ATP synthase subunit E family protein n=1 Tax=Candidatus Hadarchaeum sp. TaxID=2883567 RepID=UPI003C859014